jgi:Na+/H+-dicarboxylate symporter
MSESGKLTVKILIGIVLGIVVGTFLNGTDNLFIKDILISGLFETVANIFISLLKFLVVPLVFFSLVSGILSIQKLSKLKNIGYKATLLYLLTTILATALAIVVTFIWHPKGIIDVEGNDFQQTATIDFWNTVASIIPDNIVDAFSRGNMLQIIFVSVFFSIAMMSVKFKNYDAYQQFLSIVDLINETIIKMIEYVMKLTPYASFALVAKAVAGMGLDHFGSLLEYVVLLIVVLLLHQFGTLMLLYKIFTKQSPLEFIVKMRDVFLFAFSTASSNATMPVTIKVLKEKFNIDKTTVSFIIPLGATVNMDGTAIMQTIATIFVANTFGIDLSILDYVMIIVLTLISSIGTAGIPSVGIIMLAFVFEQLHLPTSAIYVLLGVDRLLDMIRTAVNVTGDAVVACIVASQSNKKTSLN